MYFYIYKINNFPVNLVKNLVKIMTTVENQQSTIDINDNIRDLQKKPVKRSLLWFFICTFAWSWVWWTPRILMTYNIISLPGWVGQIFSGVALFGPTIIAIIITAINSGGIGVKNLLKKMVNVKFNKIWLIPVFLVPLVVSGSAFLISILAFGYTLDANFYNGGYLVGAVFIGFFVGGPLAEELGWRGFALDRIQNRMNAFNASLLLGAIWSLWHLPLHFIDGTTQYFVPIWAFFCMNTVSTFLYTWVYNNTNKSVLVAILFHWTSNIGGALLPFWQLGIINGTLPNGTYWPTYGMLIGFAMNLLAVIIVVLIFKPKKLMLEKSKEMEEKIIVSETS